MILQTRWPGKIHMVLHGMMHHQITLLAVLQLQVCGALYTAAEGSVALLRHI